MSTGVRMTNGFAMHGIEHVSPSKLNKFASAPALFVLEYVLKRKPNVGSAAHRGKGVEAGVEYGLKNPAASVEECVAVGVAKFDSASAFSADNKRDHARTVVERSIPAALAELRQYGTPDRMQERIFVTLPDVPVPFLGYLDLGWSQHSIIMDLKTTERLPSVINEQHAQQVSLYLYGSNWSGRVGYFTPAKRAVYAIEDPARHIRDLTNVAQRCERFLRISKDPQELAGIVCPDYSVFYWNDPVTRAHGREVFGF